MIYHHIALNTILPPLTYAHTEALPLGRRVVVPLRGKQVVGVVWQSGVTPDIDLNKILPIIQVFEDEPVLPLAWRELVQFTARYYYYPLGQTLFTALPSALKEPKAVEIPQPIQFFTFNVIGRVQPAPPKHHAKKLAVWQALMAGAVDLPSLRQITPSATKLIEDYQQQGWLDISTEAVPIIPPARHLLNAEQANAVTHIQEKLGSYQPFLLHGITGSGKTEVYFEAMAQVLAQGKQVLFLLPEINLTPQLLHRVAQRFPNMPTAVLHSRASAGQRSRDYLRAMLGQAKLVIGTRLAVFTPLADLGLVVVDEEHDHSFKQDSELRYHARDLAIWRARQANCPIVLGSATPSLESWYKAQTGAYQLLSLPNRAREKAQPPVVEILDVRHIHLDNGISPQVLDLLRKNYQAGGMSLVYLNRRGFAPALFCGDCGHTFGCPNCSAKMVLHQRAGQLRCHHCDFRQRIPTSCSECGNQDLTAIGQGTQRIEETLRNALPHAQIARIDRDSVSRKNAWEDIYQQIANNRIDVLVGTQMLAKGHDFAQLNLVVVLNADGALFSSDFRAPERLFAELMQVSGRAGRAEQMGRVVIQTRLPEHPVFTAIKAQDYVLFANRELEERKMFGLSPYGFQSAVRADAVQLSEAVDFLNAIRDVVAPILPEKVFQLGAVPMLMTRLAERERAQIFIESTDRKALHHALGLWAQVLAQYRDGAIRWHIDVDAQDM